MQGRSTTDKRFHLTYHARFANGPLQDFPIWFDKRGMSIAGTALGGLRDAQSRLEKTADKVAGTSRSPDAEDPVTDMVALLDAGLQFAANARVIQTADEMQKRLIDILA